jgi:predicted metal-dependent phosphotriesterase family hydrolase
MPEIMTVLGAIASEDLGFTSMREHILYAANASVAASESWSWEPTTSSRSCCGVSEGMTTVA